MYGAWPELRKPLGELDGKRPFAVALIGEVVFAAVLCIPIVARATGIPWRLTLLIMGLCAVGTAVDNFWLGPRGRRSARWFRIQIVFDLVVMKVSTPLALVIASGDPKSPIWAGVTLVACIMGGYQDLAPSWAFLAVFLVAPFATVPFFRARGADPTWSLVGPAVNAALAGIGYHILAGYGASARALRDEQQRTIDELRRKTSQAERDRLARDLHDSVGSALSIAGLSSDLIERHANDPIALERVARSQREATSQGLQDLRGLLDAISPVRVDATALHGSLRDIADRMAQAAEIGVVIELESGAATLLDGASRLAVVRIFQEALTNAIKHGAAKTVRARLRVDGSTLHLDMADDGRGFVESQIEVGRGLPGMRGRAAELGGRCEIDSAPGGGTRVRLVLPMASS